MSKLNSETVTIRIEGYEAQVILEEEESRFERELELLAKDYDLTIREAREVVANVAAMKAKHEIMKPGIPFEW